MQNVKVVIVGKDRKVGAMVKALAVEVAGFQTVSGTTKEFLLQNGHYVFHFSHPDKAQEFRRIIQEYIPEKFVQLVYCAEIGK